jgi:hypothetical protein
MDTIMATFPQLSKSIKSQQEQLLRSVDDNTEFCKITSTSLREIQANQINADNPIAYLENVVSKLINQSTPTSSGRIWKKSKSLQKSMEIQFLHESDDDSNNHLPPTQLDLLLAHNTSAIT